MVSNVTQFSNYHKSHVNTSKVKCMHHIRVATLLKYKFLLIGSDTTVHTMFY